MRRFILVTFLSLFIFQESFSQGIYESYIIFDVNGSGNTYYDLNASTSNTDFNGNNFGIFSTSNSLYLKGFEHKVWQANDGATGFQWSRLYYKVEETSDNSQSFSNLSASYAGWIGGNNHKWLNNTANVNLLDGLLPGNYKITVYGQARDNNNTDVYDSNSGSNYIATFSIINYSSDTTISSAKSFTDLTVDPGVTLTISKSGSLTTSGNFTNNGTVTLNSDADEFSSIIVEGTSSGNITYNRYVNTVGSGEWDLVASPVGSLSISSFVSTNSSPLANNGSGTYALGYYDNSDDSWTNYTTSTTGGAGNFPLGKGYQMASTSGATLAFTGTVATSAQTQSVINNDGNGSGTRWNLVANPFPSYINLNDNNDATNNFLTVNSSKIDSDYLAVYGYDADGTGYSIYNHAGDSPGDYIAPGQAFFIAAASSSSDNISFTTAMRTTSGGDDFATQRLAQSTWSRFYLRLYEDDNFISETKFYFDQGLSLGLDPGYDAGALNQSDNMMSRLTEEDQGIGMAMNAMGLSALDEETVIPLVLNRDAGVEFSISFEDSTIPEDVGVYLEDTLLETLTDLRSEDFTLTPESDLSDMGRFYLRIGNTSLGGNDLDESYISIYKAASDDFVTIEGLSNVEKANVQLFNIIGQEVLNTTLNSNQSTQRVSTSGLTTGVYVIRLQADSSVIAKKIIIN